MLASFINRSSCSDARWLINRGKSDAAFIFFFFWFLLLLLITAVHLHCTPIQHSVLFSELFSFLTRFASFALVMSIFACQRTTRRTGSNKTVADRQTLARLLFLATGETGARDKKAKVSQVAQWMKGREVVYFLLSLLSFLIQTVNLVWGRRRRRKSPFSAFETERGDEYQWQVAVVL